MEMRTPQTVLYIRLEEGIRCVLLQLCLCSKRNEEVVLLRFLPSGAKKGQKRRVKITMFTLQNRLHFEALKHLTRNFLQSRISPVMQRTSLNYVDLVEKVLNLSGSGSCTY